MPFPLVVPPDVDDFVRAEKAADDSEPSLNSVYVALLREAIAARKRRRR